MLAAAQPLEVDRGSARWQRLRAACGPAADYFSPTYHADMVYATLAGIPDVYANDEPRRLLDRELIGEARRQEEATP